MDDLKPNIKSEVSQKEKNKHHLLVHIYEIYKDDSDEPIPREAMKMQTKRIDLRTRAGDRKERVRMERVAWKHIH